MTTPGTDATPSRNGWHGRVSQMLIAGGALRPIAHSRAALAVFLAYSAHVNEHGQAWLAESTIAGAFGLDGESVRRARRLLERAGLLTPTGKRMHRCTVYSVGKPHTGAGVRTSLTPTHARGNGKRNPTHAPSGTPHRRGANITKEARRLAAGAATARLNALAHARS